MKNLTQPLHDEHKELLPHVQRILEVADLIGTASPEAMRSGVEDVYRFLAYHLLPHAQAEDAALYPAVRKALNSPDATKTMSRDHVEVGRYIDELEAQRASLGGELTTAQERELRRILYGVYALVRVHFAKEEEVYLPILDRTLTPETSAELFEKMEAAAARAKQALAVP